MELKHIHGRAFFIPGVSNIGVIMGQDSQALLIDTGVGDRSARQVLELFAGEGLHLAAILNTHSHGDHVGGNALLVEETGACVYAPPLDAILIQDPSWVTRWIFGGAEPIPQVMVARYAPRSSPVHVLVHERDYEVAGVRIHALSLPGHTSRHTGYLVEDVLFGGDALTSEAELERVKIPCFYSVTQQLATLARLQGRPCSRYMPGHGDVREDISDLAVRNAARLHDVLDTIVEHVSRVPAQVADIVEAVCVHLGFAPRHVLDYYLLNLTIHAFISHLKRSGRITCELEGARIYWRLAHA